MEDIDGGLHPAVDGQSLDEDEDVECTVPGKQAGTDVKRDLILLLLVVVVVVVVMMVVVVVVVGFLSIF